MKIIHNITETVKSGSDVKAKWEGLSENTVHSWYAIAEGDYTGKTVSDIWTFTKGMGNQEGSGSEMEISKTYNLKNFTTKTLVIEIPYSLVDLEDTSVISEGILLETSATLKGTGLKNTEVTSSPTEKDAVIDLNGAEVKEVRINSSNIKEIRGAENVKEWIITDGVDVSEMNIYNSIGEDIIVEN